MRRRVNWVVREPPLSPRAVVGEGEAGRALARRLLADPEGLQSFQGLELLASHNILCVRADAGALPWVPGLVYLAPCPGAPQLWVPTYLRPDLDPSLLVEALSHEGQARPFAVLPDSGHVFSMSLARPSTPERLLAWMEATWMEASP